MEAIFLDRNPSPEGHGQAIYTLIRESLRRARLSVHYVAVEDIWNETAWRSAGVVIFYSSNPTTFELPPGICLEVLKGKATLQLTGSENPENFGRQGLSTTAPPLSADLFSVGTLHLPLSTAECKAALNVLHPALQLATRWARQKRQLQDSLALAAIYAAAPLAATAF